MKKTEVFQLRIGDEEKESAVKDAKKHGMDLSKYIRWLIKKEREKTEG